MMSFLKEFAFWSLEEKKKVAKIHVALKECMKLLEPQIWLFGVTFFLEAKIATELQNYSYIWSLSFLLFLQTHSLF